MPNRLCYWRWLTHTHTKTRPSEVIDWTKTGLAALVCTSLWNLDWFQIATELYHVLKCVFPASRALCLLAVHYYFLIIIIIIVVVYDYYYLSPLLAEDWHFEICFCPLMPLQKKNKLLLLILFHKSLDSEIFHLPPPSPILLHFFLFVHFAWKVLGILNTPEVSGLS